MAAARLVDLRVESLSEPLGIATAMPRFSWLVEPEHGAEGVGQANFELELTTPGGSVISSRGGR